MWTLPAEISRFLLGVFSEHSNMFTIFSEHIVCSTDQDAVT